jgi:hypothetical protein
MSLVTVYDAVDELMANSIRDLLLQNGVPAMVKSGSGIEGYLVILGGAAMFRGEVQVDETDAERALELIGGFLGHLGLLEEAELEPEVE